MEKPDQKASPFYTRKDPPYGVDEVGRTGHKIPCTLVGFVMFVELLNLFTGKHA
jgi:hypothetical protein